MKIIKMINMKRGFLAHIFLFLSVYTAYASPIVSSTQSNLITHDVDWTILGSFAMALIALVLTIYQIMQFFMGPKRIRDESLRASEFIKEIQSGINDLDERFEELQRRINNIDIGAAERKTNITNMQNEIQDIRKEQRELSRGLDALLRQLIEYLGNK